MKFFVERERVTNLWGRRKKMVAEIKKEKENKKKEGENIGIRGNGGEMKK